MQRLVLALSGVLALSACADEPTRAELEAECSPEFLLQYDMDALDTQYAPTVEAAAAYGIEDAELDLSAEANLCLEYKDQYEVQQQSYEAMSSQVEAEANAAALSVGATRIDRNLRWVTYEIDEDSNVGEYDIPTGWINYTGTYSADGEIWRTPNSTDLTVRGDYFKVDTGSSWKVSIAYPF